MSEKTFSPPQGAFPTKAPLLFQPPSLRLQQLFYVVLTIALYSTACPAMINVLITIGCAMAMGE